MARLETDFVYEDGRIVRGRSSIGTAALGLDVTDDAGCVAEGIGIVAGLNVDGRGPRSRRDVYALDADTVLDASSRVNLGLTDETDDANVFAGVRSWRFCIRVHALAAHEKGSPIGGSLVHCLGLACLLGVVVLDGLPG